LAADEGRKQLVDELGCHGCERLASSTRSVTLAFDGREATVDRTEVKSAGWRHGQLNVNRWCVLLDTW
jgi:hypothetical protein